jgi:parallel beta-helix repeat protein
MKHAAWLFVFVLACAAPRTEHPSPSEVTLAPGAPLQAAIDACPAGGVIRLEAGLYPERITIEKPLTLIGAGWDKTVIGPESSLERAPKPPQDAGSRRMKDRAPVVLLEPTLIVRNTADVALSGLRIRGPDSQVGEGTVSDEVLVRFDAAQATMSECAVLGPSMNGIAIQGASDVRIEHSLVAALWGTGVMVSSSKAAAAGTHPRAAIVASDVRNCYHRCVTIASDDVEVEGCRISGSAWHGIRYDGCSPSIQANQIFQNARSGIYASGETAARVTGNVFWKNEMDGMSCWYANADAIEGNTFVENLREGIAVLGNSQPKLERNLFVENPIGVYSGAISGDRNTKASEPVQVAFTANVFWENPVPYKSANQTRELPPGNETAAPDFVDPKEKDFALAAGSRARRVEAGASDPIAWASPFPIQPEERAIIPDIDGRDFRLWKR